MSFFGVVGVVAQAAQAGTAPTGVSIATSASGNHNNAFVSNVNNCSFTEGTFDGAFTTDTNSDGVNDRVTVSVIVDGYAAHFEGCDSGYTTEFGAYLRATGATSFSWQLSIVSQSLTGSSAALTGTITTDQNARLDSGSLNRDLVISFGGGRGGVTYPSAGDEIIIGLAGTATNSTGSTAANSLSMVFDFVNQ